MPTEFTTCDLLSVEAKRVSDEKAKFSLSLLPSYRNALDKDELDDFFAASRVLVLDRFPPLGLDRSSKQYQMKVLAEIEAFDFGLMLSCIHPDYRSMTASTGDWRPFVTLDEDRKRRREEWEASKGGVPHDHQYIVAFNTGEPERSYLSFLEYCFVG